MSQESKRSFSGRSQQEVYEAAAGRILALAKKRGVPCRADPASGTIHLNEGKTLHGTVTVSADTVHVCLEHSRWELVQAKLLIGFIDGEMDKLLG